MPSDDLFSFTSFDFNGIQGNYSALLGDCDPNKEQEAALKAKQLQHHQMFSIEELGLGKGNIPFSPEVDRAYRENNVGNKGLNSFKDQNHIFMQQQLHLQQKNPNDMMLNEFQPSFVFSFVNRFTEALFFYGAYFDTLETCLDKDIETRTTMEEILNKGIRNIVAMEGSDRITRSVKIDVWRAFLTRFRMAEIGFSDSCLYQANLVLKRFPYASCCNLDMDGKSLITGWKGTPIHSLSLWKFTRERRRLFLKYI